MSDSEEAFNKIKSKFETEVKTKNGTLVLKHDVPLGEDEINLFKEFTTQDIENILSVFGFTAHQYKD